MFLNDFGSFLETVSSVPVDIVILGDLNVHVDDAHDPFARAFKDQLEAVGLTQHVAEITHKDGHILDLVISRETSGIITGTVSVKQRMPSDHHAINCHFNLRPPHALRNTFRYRKTREIYISDFKRDIESSSLYTDPAADLDDLVNQYETVLRDLLDRHAPLVERTVIVRPNSPWYTDELRIAKRRKRQAERKFVKSGLEVDKQPYIDHCKAYKTMLETAKRNYHRSQIEDCSSKELFRVVDSLCNPTSEPPLPDHDSNEMLANDFATFFDDKITKIRSALDSSDPELSSTETQSDCNSFFFLGKVLERCCLAQVQDYFASNNLYAKAQSAYRSNHSTETALLRVQNDILQELDSNQEAVLVLLDLSAAFDTIDHEILLQRLEKRYGIGGVALSWFRSYLANRTQSVVIGDSESRQHELVYGVPQGSVLGAPLFTFYSAPLSDIIKKHNIDHLMYADNNTQIYLLFKPSEKDSAMRRIELCVKDIKIWAVANKLQFNDEKTE
ncbi:uncharacterized protein [Amphiura filiformis]|uniref:uncharacterized protein n=1 Tax=Amphiura filiformis TaxID=82378 RepID=UPI003B2140E7